MFGTRSNAKQHRKNLTDFGLPSAILENFRGKSSSRKPRLFSFHVELGHSTMCSSLFPWCTGQSPFAFRVRIVHNAAKLLGAREPVHVSEVVPARGRPRHFSHPMSSKLTS